MSLSVPHLPSRHRWRAGAAASVAARERRERLAAEKAVASTATAAAARDFAREAARERDYEARHYSLGRGGDDARRYRREADRNVGAIRSPRTEYQRTYGGGRSRRTRSEIEWEGGARQRDYAHQGYEGGAVGSDSPRAEYQRTYDGGGRDRTAGSNVERGDHGNHRDYAAQRYEGDADHATRATEPLTAGYQLRCGGSDRARTTETAFDRHGRKAYAVQNEVPRYGRNSQRSGGAAKPSTDEYQDTRGADSDHPSRAAMERAERGNRVAVGAVSTASGSPRATHSAVEQGRWEGLVRRGSSEAVETAAITVVRQHAERAVAVAVASAEDHRRESRDLQERLSRTTEERGVLERKLAGKEGGEGCKFRLWVVLVALISYWSARVWLFCWALEVVHVVRLPVLRHMLSFSDGKYTEPPFYIHVCSSPRTSPFRQMLLTADKRLQRSLAL